jgi:Protein of unknown function (DUF5672)
MSALERPMPRLFTTHGTALYVDRDSGELRHAQTENSPANARIALDGTRGVLIVPEAHGVGFPIHCRELDTHTVDRAVPAVFEVARLDHGWVALKSDGVFLSAVPDGHVSFARRVCNWENFMLADPLPARKEGIDRLAGANPSLSISCIETRAEYITRAARAVERTTGCIRVDALYWFSTLPFPNSLPGVDIVHIQVPDFTDYIEDINRIFLHLMPQVVATDFNLIVQADGFAVNPQAWDPLFWEYDYIGAPFCGLWGGGPYWRSPIVGNGGFSLRSRKLYDALLDLRIKWRVEDWLAHDDRLSNFGYYLRNAKGEKCLQEDVLMSLWARRTLETRYGIRFSPPELAGKFSLFQAHPLTQFWLGRSFGFHGNAVASYYGVTL